MTRTSGNVIAHIEGTDKKEEILTLTAHFDSVPEGPGAYDNMAGGAIIMNSAGIFTHTDHAEPWNLSGSGQKRKDFWEARIMYRSMKKNSPCTSLT